MDAFTVSDAAAEIAEGDESIEKLRTDAVSLEIMTFEEGDEDPMHAHAEDEIYHIDSGHAQLNAEGETRDVSEGDVIHLEPGTDHQFLGFEDELVMTVLYAPAKGSTE